MSRKDELLEIVNQDSVKIAQLIDEILFLEENLEKLRKLPMISVNPNNPAQQKSTPASKQYKEFLQQYTNCLKVLFKITDDKETEEESPLRNWKKEIMLNGFKGGD